MVFRQQFFHFWCFGVSKLERQQKWWYTPGDETGNKNSDESLRMNEYGGPSFQICRNDKYKSNLDHPSDDLLNLTKVECLLGESPKVTLRCVTDVAYNLYTVLFLAKTFWQKVTFCNLVVPISILDRWRCGYSILSGNILRDIAKMFIWNESFL